MWGGDAAPVRAEKQVYQQLLRCTRSQWLQDLMDLCCMQPRQFWQFLRAPIRPPVPGHSEFLQAFGTLFGGEVAEPVAADLVEAIAGVCHDLVTAGKVERAV